MSKYSEHINKGFSEAGASNVTLIGSTLLVEIVKREKKTASGLILGSVNNATGKELTEALVVATGAGHYDEDGQDVPLDTRIGDIIYIDPTHARALSYFPVAGYVPNDLALVEEGAVLMRFRGEDAFTAFRKGAGLNE